jgi:hypothetical protein
MHRHIELALLAAMALPAALSAQSEPAPDTTRTVHLRLGQGTSWNGGLAMTTGFDWQPAGRLSLRLTLDSYGRMRRITPFDQCGTSTCLTHQNERQDGAAVDSRFDLMAGTWRPYIFSGLGFYHVRFTDILSNACSDPIACPSGRGTVSMRKWSTDGFGLYSGVGVARVVTRARSQVFTEFRVQSNSWSKRSHMPFIIGFRF